MSAWAKDAYTHTPALKRGTPSSPTKCAAVSSIAFTHPLRLIAQGADVVLQDLYRLLDVVVDDGEVEEVAVGVLQQVRLLRQPLQAAVKLQQAHVWQPSRSVYTLHPVPAVQSGCSN